jgi:Zn ribbon nucleic-acid-binding protein
MVEYCPECGNSVDYIYFYGKNGLYLSACCTFCGFTERAEFLDRIRKEKYCAYAETKEEPKEKLDKVYLLP